MKSSKEEKLRSLGKILSEDERVALLIVLRKISLKHQMAEEIIEEHEKIFGFSITIEELKAAIDTLTFSEEVSEHEEAEKNREIPFYIANQYR